ncbi:MAG TPA: hypothetical protein VGV89_03655 [Thermoplasmata archaeon]|nr:hypothetical protein [Thermoplasmata archaeon]
MAAHAPASPELEAGPLLAWLAVLLVGIFGVVLLASAWTTGGLPGGALSVPVGPLVTVGLYLALILPAVAVLGVGLTVASIRWKPPVPAGEWVDSSSQNSVSGAGQ